jgi:hypothetical protein
MNVLFRPAIPVIIALLIVLCLGCRWKNREGASQSNSPKVQANSETESYAALAALIKDMYIDGETKLLVIESSCPTPSQTPEPPDAKVEEMRQQMEKYAFEKMPELNRETIDDFHARAKECYSLRLQLDIPVKYVIVGGKDLDPLFPKGELDRAWSRFYAKYPGSSGIISFSRPGFNRAFTQALISTGRSCGGLCGAGHFVLLTKDNGGWTVKTKVPTWVS